MRRLWLVLVLPIFFTSCSNVAQPEPLQSATKAEVTPDPFGEVPQSPSTTEEQENSKSITPRRLRAANLRAPIVPSALSGSELIPPDDPKVLGWWGRKAGARHGVTLLVGHTVHDGGGVLDELEDVPAGTRIVVSGASYTVASNRVISKTALARRAPNLFSQTGRHRLVVVTCEDYNPNTGTYASNVVLVANPSKEK